MKRPASLGALDRINQTINGLKKLGTLVRLHGYSGCVHNHRVTLPHTRLHDGPHTPHHKLTNVSGLTPDLQEGRIVTFGVSLPLQKVCTNRREF